MHLALEVIHQERAEDRDVVHLRDFVKQILEPHAGGDVASFPQDVDHLPPPPHLGKFAGRARFADHVLGDTEEQRCVRHRLAHEARQAFVGVDDGQLPAGLCGLDIHSLCLQAGAEGLPMGLGRHENQSFAVG